MKHMKLIAILAVALFMQPAYAKRNEKGLLKKSLHVAFYAGCAYGGWQFLRSVSLPWSPDATIRGIKDHPVDYGSRVLGSVALVVWSLRSLDKELRITDQF